MSIKHIYSIQRRIPHQGTIHDELQEESVRSGSKEENGQKTRMNSNNFILVSMFSSRVKLVEVATVWGECSNPRRERGFSHSQMVKAFPWIKRPTDTLMALNWWSCNRISWEERLAEEVQQSTIRRAVGTPYKASEPSDNPGEWPRAKVINCSQAVRESMWGQELKEMGK